MTVMPLPQVDAIRRFNRFYTRQIGVLREGLLDSPFSLAEARVLYELAHRQAPTAGALARDLDMDAGYLSRLLRRLVRDGLIAKERAETDGRRSLLHLTKAGRQAFSTLEARSRADVGAMIERLGGEDRARLAAAMDTIEALLGPRLDSAAPFVLRPHRPGDLGWIVHRHAVLYAEEYGWSGEFEALVARVAADFIDRFKPAREQCWIAERDGEIVGSVM
nr:MarR family winged helix-turn-helix transcriptional regulator [Alphaproteobacteria bacterium]